MCRTVYAKKLNMANRGTTVAQPWHNRGTTVAQPLYDYLRTAFLEVFLFCFWIITLDIKGILFLLYFARGYGDIGWEMQGKVISLEWLSCCKANCLSKTKAFDLVYAYLTWSLSESQTFDNPCPFQSSKTTFSNAILINPVSFDPLLNIYNTVQNKPSGV